MKVEILDATTYPVYVISLAAGTSYGKDNASYDRLRRCFENGHMSVFEHATATFRISGISRACCDQLRTHRHASFVVRSQRYTKPNESDGDWFVTPPWFEDVFMYRMMMEELLRVYEDSLKAGASYEDARFLLPMATKSEVTVTTNCRELFHMFDLRLDQAAQWEIRLLFNEIMKQLINHDEQWRKLMELYAYTEKVVSDD